MSLGGTLLAVSVLSLLAFTLASLSVTHLRMGLQQDRGMLASNAARSAASAAIARVIKHPEFGEEGLEEHVITIPMEEARGLVSFNEARARAADIPFSTNNLSGTADAPGADGELVPSGTVHLWALGESGGTRRRVEVILRVPPFPWAIASGSKVVTRDGVMVGAIPHGVWPPPTSDEDLLPADVVANDTGVSIVLANDSTVLGDVETPGQVVQGFGVLIRGALHPGSAPVDLPRIVAEDFAPEGEGVLPLTQDELPTRILGAARSDTDLVFNVPLVLESARLYVVGHLTLNGGVQGTGMIVATGDITIRERLSIDGLTEIGVVSGGSVKLTGQGPETSMLRGLFYAKRDLTAEHLTLVGSLITGNAATGVDLKDTRVLYQEPAEIAVTTSGGEAQPGSYMVGATRPTDENPAGIDPFLRELPADWGSLPAPAFRVEISAPADGSFPIRIVVHRGSLRIGPFDELLGDDQAVTDFAERLTAQVREVAREYRPPVRNREVGWEPNEDIIGMMRENLLSSLGGGSNPAPPLGPSPGPTALAVNISKFLPMEDRIRIVSWLEH